MCIALAFDDCSHAATPGVCLSLKRIWIVSTAPNSFKANFELNFPHSCNMEKAECFHTSALNGVSLHSEPKTIYTSNWASMYPFGRIFSLVRPAETWPKLNAVL